MFKRTPFLIKIYKNKFEVIRLDNAVTVFKDASQNPFSTDRMAVASFLILEDQLREVINELNTSTFSFFKPNLETVIQICELNNNDLSIVEIKSLRDLCELLGTPIKYVHIETRPEPLSIHEALYYINK